VDVKGRTTRVRPFPISVQGWGERGVPTGDALAAQIRELKEYHKLDGQKIAVGVDRIDYTKGLPERFRAVGRFLERHPEYRGRFTFVQLGAPSRTHISRYRALQAELETLADEINWRFQADGWRPIRFLVAHHDAVTVHGFLSLADACIVSSLHDGMNLVAKEYVSAQEGKSGALILSEFAGAARELSDAFFINPYDGERFAEAIRQALELDEAERRRRMERMGQAVRDHNIYRWAAALISDVSREEAALPTGDLA
jgi:trehalose 6-phosphate synthase